MLKKLRFFTFQNWHGENGDKSKEEVFFLCVYHQNLLLPETLLTKNCA